MCWRSKAGSRRTQRASIGVITPGASEPDPCLTADNSTGNAKQRTNHEKKGHGAAERIHNVDGQVLRGGVGLGRGNLGAGQATDKSAPEPCAKSHAYAIRLDTDLSARGER